MASILTVTSPLTQGADSVILGRLNTAVEQRRLYDKTVRHLEEFAKESLRVLCLATATIPEV